MSSPQDDKRYLRTLNPGEVLVRMKVTVGASNALTQSGGTGQSIARTGTGAYTITLDRGFANHWGFDGTVHRANASAPLTARMNQTQYTAGSTSLSFVIVDSSGNPADPSQNDWFTLDIIFDELGIVA